MAFQYRLPDGKVDPKQLRACRRQVLQDRDMPPAERAGWLSRFDQIERSKDSPHQGRLVSMTAPDGGGVSIDMFGDIGEGFWSEGITAQQIARQIDGVTGTVKIRMNSGGGSAFEGATIGNLLSASPARVEVDILALSASAASIIAMAADEIRIAENAVMMIHDAWTSTNGGVEEHEASAQLLRAINDGAAQTYARRSGKPAEEMRDLMAKETWFTAQEAVEIGLADKVVPGKSIQQAWDWDELPAHVQARLRPTAEHRDIDPDMRNIAIRLGLTEQATEAEVLAVVDALLAVDEAAQDEADDKAQASEAVATESVKEVQAAAQELHQASCGAAVERYITAGKIPPAMREQAVKACGLTAQSLKAQCDLWDQYPSLVNRVELPKKLPAAKQTTLTPLQKKLARMAKLTDEQWLAAQENS